MMRWLRVSSLWEKLFLWLVLSVLLSCSSCGFLIWRSAQDGRLLFSPMFSVIALLVLGFSVVFLLHVGARFWVSLRLWMARARAGPSIATRASYLGGHPLLLKTGEAMLLVTSENLAILVAKRKVEIPLRDVRGTGVETEMERSFPEMAALPGPLRWLRLLLFRPKAGLTLVVSYVEATGPERRVIFADFLEPQGAVLWQHRIEAAQDAVLRGDTARMQEILGKRVRGPGGRVVLQGVTTLFLAFLVAYVGSCASPIVRAGIEDMTRPASTPAPQNPAVIAMPTESPPTPTSSPQSAVGRVIKVELLNVRQGPGEGYAVIARIGKGTQVVISGANPEDSWLQISLADGRIGWVYRDFIEVSGGPIPITTAAPAKSPTPTPAPSSASDDAPQPSKARTTVLVKGMDEEGMKCLTLIFYAAGREVKRIHAPHVAAENEVAIAASQVVIEGGLDGYCPWAACTLGPDGDLRVVQNGRVEFAFSCWGKPLLTPPCPCR